MALKTVTVPQIQKLDKMAINKYGLPSVCLMENAGAAVAEEAIALVKKAKKPKVGIVCGSGNNAGDGFVAARHLRNAGLSVEVTMLTEIKDLSPDARIHFNVIKKSGVSVKKIRKVTSVFHKHIAGYDLVVDAVFGVGLNRNVAGIYADVIESVNNNARKVLAVDVPSGLDAGTGRIFGVSVKAHTTVTMTFAKRGFVKCLGPKFCGKIKVVDIGIPANLKSKI